MRKKPNQEQSPNYSTYGEYLESKARVYTPTESGYYVEGARSDFEIAVMSPVVALTKGIKTRKALRERMRSMLENKDPLLEELAGEMPESK